MLCVCVCVCVCVCFHKPVRESHSYFGCSRLDSCAYTIESNIDEKCINAIKQDTDLLIKYKQQSVCVSTM